MRSYIIFHLNPTVKPVDDGVRKAEQMDDAWRERSNMLIKANMIIFKPKKFYEVTFLELDERVSFCIETIQKSL